MQTENGIVNTKRLSEALVASYIRTCVAERPIDKKTAQAEFKGMCKAVDAIGLAMTPTHVELVVHEAYQAAGDRPGFRAVNNKAQQEFDAHLAMVVRMNMHW